MAFMTITTIRKFALGSWLWLVLPVYAAAGDGPWMQVIDDQQHHVRVEVRAVPGTGVREFRAYTQVHARLASLVALLEDTEHLPAWMHRVRRVTVLDRSDARQLHSYLVLAVPFPFHDRDTFMKTSLTQDADGTVHLRSESEPGGRGACLDCVRMLQMRNEWILRPGPHHQVDVIFDGMGLPGGVVPDWATNLVVTDLPFGSLRNLHRQVHRHKYEAAQIDGIKESE